MPLKLFFNIFRQTLRRYISLKCLPKESKLLFSCNLSEKILLKKKMPLVYDRALMEGSRNEKIKSRKMIVPFLRGRALMEGSLEQFLVKIFPERKVYWLFAELKVR